MMDYITLFEKRRRDMMKLWKDTFHDSDRYISLVFDTYFSLENSFVRYHENRIIAALLCVGYEFQILMKEGNKRHVKGMYLCGLATHPEWRKKGIMGELMEEAENAAKRRGYDWTFLIPADEHLREYYRRKGYLTASWRKIREVRREKEESDEDKKALHIYSIKEFFKGGKIEFLHDLAEWCRDIELSRQCDTIVHSLRDMLAIMAENENSIFFTNPTFNPEYPILANVQGVVFPDVSDRSDGAIRIVGLYTKSTSSNLNEGKSRLNMMMQNRRDNKFASEIRDLILKSYNRSKLELLLPFSEINELNIDLQPYAMIKRLNENSSLTPQNENLQVEISLMLD